MQRFSFAERIRKVLFGEDIAIVIVRDEIRLIQRLVVLSDQPVQLVVRIADGQTLVFVNADNISAFVIHVTQALAVPVGHRRDLMRRVIPCLAVAVAYFFDRLRR